MKMPGVGGDRVSCQDLTNKVQVEISNEAARLGASAKGFGHGADIQFTAGGRNESVFFMRDQEAGTLSAFAVSSKGSIIHIMASALKSSCTNCGPDTNQLQEVYAHALATSTGDEDYVSKSGLSCTFSRW